MRSRTIRATTSSTPTFAAAASRASRRARPARSTTGASWRPHRRIRSTSNSCGTCCRRRLRPLPKTPASRLRRRAANAGGGLAAVAQAFSDSAPGATIPPAGAAHPQVNLYTHREPVTATVVGNFRVTDGDVESDTHHIVLDFGAKPFPVLEGQSIGMLPPGVDAAGRAASSRASIRCRARAMANGAATTTSR